MKELRDYQKEDVEFIKTLNSVGIFSQQRTGKTPTALMSLKDYKKIIIVCPASLLYQWKGEFEYWLERPCVVIAGTPKQRTAALNSWTDGAIISYDLLKKTARTKGYIEEILNATPNAIILDEAHRIKNPQSATARAVYKFVDIPKKLALTGTPSPNRPEDVFSVLHFLYPKAYNSYWSFIYKYFNVVSRTNGYGQSFKEITTFKPGMKQKLLSELRSFCLQRKRKEVMEWLPEKDRVLIKLPPSTQQKKYLNELSKYYETEDVIVKGTLDRLIRYRQICLHPGLLDLKGNSPKLEWILQYINDYPDEPIIIFSKFTTFLKILSKELEKEKKVCGVIIGETPVMVRNDLKLRFQKGELNLLLINIDAGKEGLTLDRAETIIFSDKFPPIGDIEQAEDRFIATTKDKMDKPHKIIDLVIEGTYDEEVHKLLQKRASQVDVINNFKKYIGGD